MKFVEKVISRNQSLINSSEYEWCILMAMDFHRKRKDKNAFLENFLIYDKIELWRFCDNKRVFQKLLSVACCCLGMELFGECLQLLRDISLA